MQNTAYRLAEYKIIENEHGDLWWESHTGLGSVKSGKCFIKGGILFIAPSDITGPGFLKGEFLDHLYKLSNWEKTKYYCSSYKIYVCKSRGRKPHFERLDSRLKSEINLRPNGSTQRTVAKASLESIKPNTAALISYKLGRYEIGEMDNGQLFWKSPGGLGSLKRGRCHIRGSILFLEPGEIEQSNLTNKEFLQKLNRLPDWERTKYFCPSYTIYYCITGAICRSLGEDKDFNGTVTQNFVDNHKANAVGITSKPIIVNKGDPKENLEVFFNLFKLLVILILKLLCGGLRIAYMVLRNCIARWRRFRGY